MNPTHTLRGAAGRILAALERWQLTGHDRQLRLGQSLVRGPVERDRDLGTCRVEVRLGRGLLRPPLRMRLDIDRLSSTSTALLQPAAVQAQPAMQKQDIWRERQPAPSPAP